MARGALLRGGGDVLTEVVLTPQSNSGLVGVRAGGVSIHSKVSSDVFPSLILLVVVEFCKTQRAKQWASAGYTPSQDGVISETLGRAPAGVQLPRFVSRPLALAQPLASR